MKVITIIRDIDSGRICECFTSPTKKESLSFIKSIGWYNKNYNIAIFKHTPKMEVRYGDQFGKFGMGNIVKY